MSQLKFISGVELFPAAEWVRQKKAERF
jgi:hypothetical protein